MPRRTLIEWLGAGAVLSLAEVATGCSSGETNGDVVQPPPPANPCSDAGTLPFEPSDESASIYDDWNVATVDTQDLPTLLAGWHLQVDGLVEAPATLSFAELMGLPAQKQVTDLQCVEGWSVYDIPWVGVHFQTLLDLVRPAANATHLVFHSFGGTYLESLPIEVALEPKTMLAYGVDCATLPLAHGFPARVVVPRKFGYKNAKYITRVELSDHPVDGFWTQFGYTYDGDVQPERLRPGKY